MLYYVFSNVQNAELHLLYVLITFIVIHDRFCVKQKWTVKVYVIIEI